MSFWDLGISSALGAIGSFFGQQSANESNQAIASSANAFSARQAELNRSFQERMSNTSWQRGIADMRAAGVNPMLMVSQGGASSPSGSSAIGTTGAPMKSSVSEAVSSALAIKQLQATLRNIDADTKVKDATASNVAAQLPGLAASSAFQANKFGAMNDVVDVAKRAVNYNKTVNSAKSTADKPVSDSIFHADYWRKRGYMNDNR